MNLPLQRAISQESRGRSRYRSGVLFRIKKKSLGNINLVKLFYVIFSIISLVLILVEIIPIYLGAILKCVMY